MEYIDGITLTEFLMDHARLNRRPPVDICTFIVSRICRGLEYAHTKKGEGGVPLGLVHRDVSPNNIMISHEGEVKLTDFGVAKAGQFMDADEDSLVGSVEYMSPEQAACAAVDARSDLFSLGLVYYELLTGVRVFQYRGEEIEQSLEKVKTHEIPDVTRYRRDLPPDVAERVMKCIQRRPSKRFQAAGELSEALECSMYSKGVGPTMVSLSRYVADMRAEIGPPENE
jgi:serine/threonine-protein kinase